MALRGPGHPGWAGPAGRVPVGGPYGLDDLECARPVTARAGQSQAWVGAGGRAQIHRARSGSGRSAWFCWRSPRIRTGTNTPMMFAIAPIPMNVTIRPMSLEVAALASRGSIAWEPTIAA